MSFMRMSSTRLLRHSQHIDHEDELKVKTVLDDVDSTYRPRSSPTTILLLYIMYLRQCLASSCTVVLLSSRASRLEVLCRPLCRFISSPPLCCKQYTRRQKEKKNNNEIKAVLVKQGGQASMAYWDTQGSSDPVIHKMITWSLLRLPTQAIIVVVQQRR